MREMREQLGVRKGMRRGGYRERNWQWRHGNTNTPTTKTTTLSLSLSLSLFQLRDATRRCGAGLTWQNTRKAVTMRGAVGKDAGTKQVKMPTMTK